MSRKKAPKEEWVDPSAPSERIGELNALMQDLVHVWICDSIEELSGMGVRAEWSKESDAYCFSTPDRTLRKIAQQAYSIGIRHQQYLAVRDELEKELKRFEGTKKSATKRSRNSLDKQALVLVAYAELAARGEKQIKEKVAARLRLGESIVERAIARFNQEIEQAAASLKKKTPRLSLENVVAQIVAKHADSTVGLNEATVRVALKPKKKRRQ